MSDLDKTKIELKSWVLLISLHLKDFFLEVLLKVARLTHLTWSNFYGYLISFSEAGGRDIVFFINGNLAVLPMEVY